MPPLSRWTTHRRYCSQGYSIDAYMSKPLVQVKVGAAYIKGRYGSPTKAWAFWQANGWY